MTLFRSFKMFVLYVAFLEASGVCMGLEYERCQLDLVGDTRVYMLWLSWSADQSKSITSNHVKPKRQAFLWARAWILALIFLSLLFYDLL